jgi:hypothetical protein
MTLLASHPCELVRPDCGGEIGLQVSDCTNYLGNVFTFLSISKHIFNST